MRCVTKRQVLRSVHQHLRVPADAEDVERKRAVAGLSFEA